MFKKEDSRISMPFKKKNDGKDFDMCRKSSNMEVLCRDTFSYPLIGVSNRAL